MFTDVTFSGEVIDGRLKLSDEQSYRKQIAHFKPGKVVVRVEVDRGKRTNQANRYYRLVLGLISDDTGDEPDDLHEFFKRKFLASEIRNVFGQEVEVWTTVDKDPERFYRYVEDIRRFALVERGIITPDPDPAMRGRSRHAKRKEAA